METNNNGVVESPETVPAVRDSYLRRHYFPEGFVVGSGTSAYQVKGAADSGGKGRSSWDDFARRTPGLTYKNKTVMTMGKNSTVNSTNGNIESEKKTASTYAVLEPYDALKIPLTKILTDFQKHLRERANHMLGFPCNQNCEHYLDLSSFLVYKINNVGDPFKESNYGVQSKKFEIGVLNWFSELWEIPKDEYWGYVTNGGTEGNLEALILGRESLPDGILYTSEDTHYSVFKAVRLYRMKCEKIKSLPSGEIDCSHLREKLLQNKDKPAIINVTIGTTFKGAIDNVDLVINTLEECGFSEDRFYIHCDAALYGLITPFIQKESKVISFKKRIASVSVSGHKLLGSPIPSGVVITRKKYIDNFSHDVEYIGSVDNTISGSRNGLTPLFLWYTLNLKGREGIQQDVEKCLANALYLRDRLQDIGINAMLNEMSIIVIFDKPSDERFIKYWQLSTEGNMAHVVVMPHVTIEMLDSFVNDFVMISKRS